MCSLLYGDHSSVRLLKNINKIREKTTITSPTKQHHEFPEADWFQNLHFWRYSQCTPFVLGMWGWHTGGVPFADARETEQPLWGSGCCPGLTSIFKEAPWGSKIRTVTCPSIERGTFQPTQEAITVPLLFCFCLKQWGVQTTEQQLLERTPHFPHTHRPLLSQEEPSTCQLTLSCWLLPVYGQGISPPTSFLFPFFYSAHVSFLFLFYSLFKCKNKLTLVNTMQPDSSLILFYPLNRPREQLPSPFLFHRRGNWYCDRFRTHGCSACYKCGAPNFPLSFPFTQTHRNKPHQGGERLICWEI